MSTQLLESPTQADQADRADRADEITGEFAGTVAPRTEGVSFDRATRQRLLVAEQVADTLESLSDSRAWDRLDSAVQSHLLTHARALQDHVAHLGSQRVVRGVEHAALRLKRLERRLEIAVDQLAPPADGKRAPGGLFLGDFTEAELLDDGTGTGTGSGETSKKPKKGKKESKRAKAAAALGAGVKRFKSRAERAASKAVSRRITLYIVAGLIVTGGAVIWNLKESFSEARHVSRPPSTGFQMDQHLKEVRVFLPATTTVLRDRSIRVVVSKEWLLRTEAQRRTDAAGAHVWLSNRNINQLMITWDDGTPLARYQDGQATWYDPATPGVKQAQPPH